MRERILHMITTLSYAAYFYMTNYILYNYNRNISNNFVRYFFYFLILLKQDNQIIKIPDGNDNLICQSDFFPQLCFSTRYSLSNHAHTIRKMKMAITRKEELTKQGLMPRRRTIVCHEIRVNVEIFRLQIFSYC